MNWLRGLFRLWVVTSVFWVAYVFIGAPNEFDSPYPRRLDWTISRTRLSASEREFFRLAMVAVIPPTTIIALGCVLLWVGRGFRRD